MSFCWTAEPIPASFRTSEPDPPESAPGIAGHEGRSRMPRARDGLEHPLSGARKADGDQPPGVQRRGEARNLMTEVGMTELVQAFPPTIFTTPRSYRAGPDAPEWKDDQKAGRIPYGDVAQVNISSMGWPFGQTQNRCVLRTRSGGKTVLSSVSYQRLGVIEDRSATYARWCGRRKPTRLISERAPLWVPPSGRRPAVRAAPTRPPSGRRRSADRTRCGARSRSRTPRRRRPS
jgi:hypothetical protein